MQYRVSLFIANLNNQLIQMSNRISIYHKKAFDYFILQLFFYQIYYILLEAVKLLNL